MQNCSNENDFDWNENEPIDRKTFSNEWFRTKICFDRVKRQLGNGLLKHLVEDKLETNHTSPLVFSLSSTKMQ